MQCVPHEDEEQVLRSYVAGGGQLQLLSEAEVFCWHLMQVGLCKASGYRGPEPVRLLFISHRLAPHVCLPA